MQEPALFVHLNSFHGLQRGLKEQESQPRHKHCVTGLTMRLLATPSQDFKISSSKHFVLKVLTKMPFRDF